MPGARNIVSRNRLGLALVLALFLGLMIYLSARESYWLDEGYTLRRVETSWAQLYNPFLKPVVENSTHPFDTTEVWDLNPPLYFALMRAAAGPHPGRVAARLFSAVPMALAILIAALVARRGGGPWAMAAVLAAGATSPALIYYGHEARPYAMPLAAACVLAWAVERFAARPRRLFWAACALTAAGCLMHFAFAWWVIALSGVLGLTALAAQGRGDRAARNGALAGLGGCAAGSLIALAAVAPAWAVLHRCRYAPSWSMTGEVLMKSFALPFCGIGEKPVTPWLGAGLQAGLAAVILKCGMRDSQLTTHNSQPTFRIPHFLTLWLVPLALPVIAKYWFNVAFIERYAFASLAGWLMCVGWVGGLAGATRGRIRFFARGLLVLILLTNAAWCARNLGRPLRTPWRPAAQYLKQNARPGDLYTIDPYSENPCFAANAGTPPPARYINLAGGMPEFNSTLWILADDSAQRWDEGRLDANRWSVRRVLALRGLDVFAVKRKL